MKHSKDSKKGLSVTFISTILKTKRVMTSPLKLYNII